MRYPKYKPLTSYKIKHNEYATILVSLVNFAGQHLSNNERSLLMFYLSRTVRFHKDNEYIPLRHIQEGVTEHEGECVCINSPIPGSKNTLKTCRDSLIEKGLIRKQLLPVYPHTTQIVVLVENIKDMVDMAALKISKKHIEKYSKSTESSGVKINLGGVKRSASNNVNINNEKKNKDIKNSSSSSVEDIVSDVKTRHRAKRNKTLSTKKKFSGKAFKETWNASTAEFSLNAGGVAENLSMREQGIAFKAFQSSPVFQDSEWQEYIKHVISNWDMYAAQLLDIGYGKTHDVPLIPNFTYFMYHHKKGFYPMYLEHRKGTDIRRSRVDKTTGMQKQIDRKDSRIKQLEEENRLLQSNAKKKARSKRSDLLGYLTEKANNNREVFQNKTVSQIESDFNSVTDLPEWEDTERGAH